MDADILSFFDKMPQALPLYDAFERKLRAQSGKFTIRVQKSQISFSTKHHFKFVWLPVQRIIGSICRILIIFKQSKKVQA
ncbi:MAG: DUF5655 domain-containing protein [Bacillota bacterium]